MNTETQTPIQQAVQAVRRHYFTPSVQVDAEVSLNEFSMRQIVEYVRRKGSAEDRAAAALPWDDAHPPAPQSDGDGGGLYIEEADLRRIEMLAVCGQGEVAKAMALALIGEKIGRAL